MLVTQLIETIIIFLDVFSTDLHNFIYFVAGDDEAMEKLKDPEAPKKIYIVSKRDYPLWQLTDIHIITIHNVELKCL